LRPPVEPHPLLRHTPRAGVAVHVRDRALPRRPTAHLEPLRRLPPPPVRRIRPIQRVRVVIQIHRLARIRVVVIRDLRQPPVCIIRILRLHTPRIGPRRHRPVRIVGIRRGPVLRLLRLPQPPRRRIVCEAPHLRVAVPRHRYLRQLPHQVVTVEGLVVRSARRIRLHYLHQLPHPVPHQRLPLPRRVRRRHSRARIAVRRRAG